MVDKRSASPDQGGPAAQDGEIGLRLQRAMAKGIKQSRIETADAGEVLGIYPIALALVLVDGSQSPRVGHVHFVAQVQKKPADPRRVQTSLKHNPVVWLAGET